MKLDKYALRVDYSYKIFEFTSEGPKGQITKEIIFERTGDPFVFNLAFGDKCPNTGRIDDLVVTDNGDTEKVLATIVAAVLKFLKKYPLTYVQAAGSTASRNRMYRMGISKYFLEIQEDYNIMGILEDVGLEPYQKDKNYQGFAIRSKNRKFNV